jgi:sugar diacid utilization regulator
MHLHPNSLRHRLARVHELTGRNPLLFRDQVDLAIALRARARRGGLAES